MIMDQGLNVDDLFGESSSLELGLPGALPPPKGLAQTLDEMRLLGCRQYDSPTKPKSYEQLR